MVEIDISNITLLKMIDDRLYIYIYIYIYILMSGRNRYLQYYTTQNDR